LSYRAPIRRVLALLAVALGSRVVRADPRLFVDLDYQPDAELAGCPSDSTFRAMIRDELGYDPFHAGAEQKVVARARAAEHGLDGFVEWYDASGTRRGERELRSETTDCAALARAMSFAIAVQIQLLSRQTETPMDVPSTERADDGPTGATGASPAPVPSVSHPPDAHRGTSERTSEDLAPWQFMLGAGPTLAFGLAPRTALEGRVFGGARRGRLAIELGAEASLPSRYAMASGGGFEQHILAGSAAGCAFFGRFSGCIVSKLGRLYVRGFGVDLPNSASGTLAQIGPRVSLTEGFGDRWLGALRVEALATLLSWEVTLNQREVWKTPLFSLSVGGDVALLFQ
jgi:hypothetical protein